MPWHGAKRWNGEQGIFTSERGLRRYAPSSLGVKTMRVILTSWDFRSTCRLKLGILFGFPVSTERLFWQIVRVIQGCIWWFKIRVDRC